MHPAQRALFRTEGKVGLDHTEGLRPCASNSRRAEGAREKPARVLLSVQFDYERPSSLVSWKIMTLGSRPAGSACILRLAEERDSQ